MSKKGALGLLSSYGDSSSDEEIPFGRVSTKRVHKSDSEDKTGCAKQRLPVPMSIADRKPILLELHEDNPDLHGGRSRSFPHERGNWVTYVYISYHNNLLISALTNYVLQNYTSLELKKIDDLHISLTKTFVLRYHWIETFVKTVQDKMCDVNRFIIMFEGFKIYCNEDRSRTFIGLQIRTGKDSLIKLVEILDACLEEFKLPKFYEDPSFHMSIMWSLGDKEEELNGIIEAINDQLIKLLETYDCSYIIVNNLLCKSGNKMYNFNLK